MIETKMLVYFIDYENQQSEYTCSLSNFVPINQFCSIKKYLLAKNLCV